MATMTTDEIGFYDGSNWYVKGSDIFLAPKELVEQGSNMEVPASTFDGLVDAVTAGKHIVAKWDNSSYHGTFDCLCTYDNYGLKVLAMLDTIDTLNRVHIWTWRLSGDTWHGTYTASPNLDQIDAYIPYNLWSNNTSSFDQSDVNDVYDAIQGGSIMKLEGSSANVAAGQCLVTRVSVNMFSILALIPGTVPALAHVVFSRTSTSGNWSKQWSRINLTSLAS